MIKKTLIFILCLSILINISYAVQPTPIPGAENIIFIDLLHHGNGDKELIVFQDGIYYGTFNYSDTILFNPDVNYTIIIDEDYIDIMQDESFFTNVVNNYGNLFISIIIITCLFGIVVFIYKKSKR
jgi:hypothetical protein